jgi:hypothetical protein
MVHCTPDADFSCAAALREPLTRRRPVVRICQPVGRAGSAANGRAWSEPGRRRSDRARNTRPGTGVLSGYPVAHHPPLRVCRSITTRRSQSRKITKLTYCTSTATDWHCSPVSLVVSQLGPFAIMYGLDSMACRRDRSAYCRVRRMDRRDQNLWPGSLRSCHAREAGGCTGRIQILRSSC